MQISWRLRRFPTGEHNDDAAADNDVAAADDDDAALMPLLPGWFCSAGAPLTDSWVFCCINKLHCFPQNPLCFPTSALLSEIPAQAWGSPKSLKLLLITVTPDTVNLARQALHPQSTKLPQTTTIIFGKQRYGETNYINQPEPTKTKQNQLRWPKLAVTSLPLYFSRALTGRIIRG